MFKPKSKVVFFGAHTDDEMICAGTLHRLVREGHQVHVVTFSPAATEGDRLGTLASLPLLTEEWERSMAALGVVHSRLVGLTPSVDFHPFRQRIAQFVYDWCEGEKPDVAFVLSPEDENTAHRILGEECERVMRGRVGMVIRCLFPWNYGIGRPNLYVRIFQADIEAKCKVIQAYKSQHFRYAYQDMLIHYVKADGLSVKVAAAERFELIRAVVM